MDNIKTPETKAELLELLEKLNEVAGDILAQLKQWDIILQDGHRRINHWDHTNGPDPKFMEALARGDHLDINKLPL